MKRCNHCLEGWYTSWSGGFAHVVPCDRCNPKGEKPKTRKHEGVSA